VQSKIDRLKRKPAIVRANGIMYRGILLEVTEDEITLKTQTRFLTIPMSQITAIEDPEEKASKLRDTQIDKSFYDADLYNPEGSKKG